MSRFVLNVFEIMVR